MKPHSVSVDEDLKNAAKQVEVFAISFYLFLSFTFFPLLPAPSSPPLPTFISESAESYSIHL
jgi:N-acetyltransferase 10